MKKIDTVCKKSDRVLKVLQNNCPDINYSAFVLALRKKDVIVNGMRIKENITIPSGSEICVYVADCSKKQLFEIFYEDTNIIVANKDVGIEVCDGEYNIENILSEKYSGVKAVHRLDRNTKGLVVFAKNKEVLDNLIECSKKHQIRKFYLAEVVGNPPKDSQTLKAYLVKDKETAQVKVFQNKVANSNIITTKYKVIKRGNQTSLLEIEINDGKTHQIRAHLAYINLPIVGDGKYGDNKTNKKMKQKTQELTAYKLLFELSSDNPLNYLNDKDFQITFDYLKNV